MLTLPIHHDMSHCLSDLHVCDSVYVSVFQYVLLHFMKPKYVMFWLTMFEVVSSHFLSDLHQCDCRYMLMSFNMCFYIL
jgi:hypothetical protein